VLVLNEDWEIWKNKRLSISPVFIFSYESMNGCWYIGQECELETNTLIERIGTILHIIFLSLYHSPNDCNFLGKPNAYESSFSVPQSFGAPVYIAFYKGLMKETKRTSCSYVA
jgi:hypothetical protein